MGGMFIRPMAGGTEPRRDMRQDGGGGQISVCSIHRSSAEPPPPFRPAPTKCSPGVDGLVPHRDTCGIGAGGSENRAYKSVPPTSMAFKV